MRRGVGFGRGFRFLGLRIDKRARRQHQAGRQLGVLRRYVIPARQCRRSARRAQGQHWRHQGLDSEIGRGRDQRFKDFVGGRQHMPQARPRALQRRRGKVRLQSAHAEPVKIQMKGQAFGQGRRQLFVRIGAFVKCYDPDRGRQAPRNTFAFDPDFPLVENCR